MTNQTYAIPVIITTSKIGTCHSKDQLIGKGSVPRNHLFIQECVCIDIEMSVIAFCFSGRVVIAFLVSDVIQIRVTFAVPEITIN